MVYATIWIGGRSDLVVMERDPDSPRGGYSTNSYIEALEQGLLPFYEPDFTYQQDNAPIHRSAVKHTQSAKSPTTVLCGHKNISRME